MFCDAILELIEPIAAGDLMPDAAVAAHLTTCTGCRAALADAREIERLLQARPTPAAPAQFTSRTLARVRRERWRRDQMLDAIFNTTVILIVVAVAAAIWLVMTRSGLATVSDDAVDLLENGVVAVAQRVAPSVPIYAAAAGLLAGAVGLWWWAERDASLR